jgi:hypothetical protein
VLAQQARLEPVQLQQLPQVLAQAQLAQVQLQQPEALVQLPQAQAFEPEAHLSLSSLRPVPGFSALRRLSHFALLSFCQRNPSGIPSS